MARMSVSALTTSAPRSPRTATVPRRTPKSSAGSGSVPYSPSLERKRQRHVRQRKHVRADSTCGSSASVNSTAPAASVRASSLRGRIADDRRPASSAYSWRSRQQRREHRVAVAGLIERARIGAAIAIEQHELAAVLRQHARTELSTTRAREDGGVEHRLEGEHGRIVRRARRRPRARSNFSCTDVDELRGLPRGVHGKRVVLERVVLGQRVEPGGLRERRETPPASRARPRSARNS